MLCPRRQANAAGVPNQYLRVLEIKSIAFLQSDKINTPEGRAADRINLTGTQDAHALTETVSKPTS